MSHCEGLPPALQHALDAQLQHRLPYRQTGLVWLSRRVEEGGRGLDVVGPGRAATRSPR